MSDILAALAATNPGTAGHRCKVGRWLDSLADQPGADELVATFQAPPGRPEARTLPQLCAIAHRLGTPMSDKVVSEHRNGVCRCTW